MTQTTGPGHDQWGTPWPASGPANSPGAGPANSPGGMAEMNAVQPGRPTPTPAQQPAQSQPMPSDPDHTAQTQHLPPAQAPAQAWGPVPQPPGPAPQPPESAPPLPTAAREQDPAAGPPAPVAQADQTQRLPAPPNLWAAPPPNGPGGYAPPRQREPRRPGWGGVVAVGAGAALLSSLLTAGVISVADRGNDSSASAFLPSTSSSQVSPPVTGSSNTNPDWVAVAGAVEPSVVSVQISGQSGSGEGSGVILDGEGHVLTNNHVVDGAAGNGSITVVLHDGRLYPASTVGTDPSTDLAVLKINNAPSNLKPATLGDSSAVKVGDQVMAAGNPLGLSDTVTTGIVSALNRPVTTSSPNRSNPFSGGAGGESVVTNAIQTDAAINPGNSGGALVDSQGRVIGITSSIASLGASLGGGQAGNIGLGFAIPINEAKDVAGQLIADGTAEHAWVGVSLVEDTVKVDGAERQAAILRSVKSGAPADRAGLRAGDGVVAVNGVQVSGADSLVAQIRQFQPGTKVTLTIVRDGSTKQVDITLGTRPSDN
jgi:putative serine protease PepD